MVIIKRLLGLLAIAALLLLGGCGDGDDDSPGATNEPRNTGNGAGATVELKDLKFKPDEVSIKAGSAVTWVWEENLAHNVTGSGFKSGNQNKGEFNHTFEEAGTFKYTCTLHPGMDGVVKVS